MLLWKQEVMSEKEILDYECKQAHAQMVKEDKAKRQQTHWALQAEDARRAALMGATA